MPVDGKPPVNDAWSLTEPPRTMLVELTTVVRAGVALVTVKAKTGAVEEEWDPSPP